MVLPVSDEELDSVQVGGLVDVGCDFLGQDPGPGGFQGGDVESSSPTRGHGAGPLLLSGATFVLEPPQRAHSDATGPGDDGEV